MTELLKECVDDNPELKRTFTIWIRELLLRQSSKRWAAAR